jgi:hypothetical protein
MNARRVLAVSSVLYAASVFAQAQPDRFSASGYFSLATRPDWQGGNGRLGLWNLYGRLMNEGSYSMLELGGWKLDKALPLPLQAELPLGGVFELKLVSRTKQWEKGPNRVLFVADEPGPLEVPLAWRGS